MSVIFFVLAAFWVGFAGNDYATYGANHDFWIDVFMIFSCLFLAIWTSNDNK